MDFIKDLAGGSGGNHQDGQQGEQKTGGGGGFLGGIGNKLNNAAGGGEASEKNEDYLDKGIDLVQEKVFKQGPQNNESAMEQAKDEQISDFIRDKYKSFSGNELPIKDKPTSLDKSTD
ncbi:hypothetical protein Tdes44962_MAKER03025 [Teratosphaeria destructans]|uniref:DNA damage-responsive protein 48 n=1 Tax=Teratosphaeria destructans TaxID=418781 RepID=A0A9W7W2A4_9PEZI|nr:hypothetical protein Tdes44962_MAKER03025 [Teratosphaeria destructans]